MLPPSNLVGVFLLDSDACSKLSFFRASNLSLFLRLIMVILWDIDFSLVDCDALCFPRQFRRHTLLTKFFLLLQANEEVW